MRRVALLACATVLITAGLSLLGTTSSEAPVRAALADSDNDAKLDVTSCAELFTELVNSSLAYEIVPNGTTLSCTGVSQTPIAGFTGSLDGNGAILTDINISCTTLNCGVFATLAGSTTISNLTISGGTLSSNTGQVGTLAGSAGSSSTTATFDAIQIVNSNVSGSTITGGLVGACLSCVLSSISVSGAVSATGDTVGGIAGYLGTSTTNYDNRISNSTSSATVSGANYVGGFVGKMSRQSASLLDGIRDSTFSGSASGTARQIGGFVGFTSGGGWNFENLASTGSVSGTELVGGIIGWSRSNAERIYRTYSTGNLTQTEPLCSSGVGGIAGNNDSLGKMTIEQSFSLSTILGACRSGGLVGQNRAEIIDSFFRGSITRAAGSTDSVFGGIMGRGGTNSSITRAYAAVTALQNAGDGASGDLSYPPSCSNTFWDKETSGRSTSRCASVGKTTAEMKTQATFTNWDFTTVWAIDPNVNDGYPFLRNVGVASLPGGQNWTPPDTTAPTLQSSVPADNATGVATNADIILTFSENVSAVANTNVVIKESGGTVFETIVANDNTRVTVANNVVTVDPSGTFDPLTGYFVEIDSGAFEDSAGNDYSGISGNTTFDFTTAADTTAPTVTLTTATIDNTQNAVVQSTETGTAYLVDSTVSVSALSDITNAAGTSWNSVTITTANTATNLAATGLVDGTYKAYAVDTSGNLSAPSSGTVSVTTQQTGTNPNTPVFVPTPTTTPPTTTPPPTTSPLAPSIESATPLPPGGAISVRSDGTEIRAEVQIDTTSAASTITIRNEDGTMLTVRHEPTLIRTAFDIYRGTRLAVTGDGYESQTSIDVWLNSMPTLLGSTSTLDDGTFDLTVTIPGTFTLGEHTLQIEGTVSTDIIQSTFLGVRVLDRDSGMARPFLPITGTGSGEGAALVIVALGIVALHASRRRPAVSGAGTSPIR